MKEIRLEELKRIPKDILKLIDDFRQKKYGKLM